MKIETDSGKEWRVIRKSLSAYHFQLLSVAFLRSACRSLLIFVSFFITTHYIFADDNKPSWIPKIQIYQPPPPEISTSPVFRTVDPQIIQKLIDLLDETTLSQTPTEKDPSLEQLRSFRTPEGLKLSTRYEHLGIALSESLGWEPIKHIRVISEQNLKQRLTTVARWDHTPIIRSIAIISLALIKDKNDIVYFREALWSRNIGIRFAAIEALQVWGFPEAVPVLKEIVEKDESSLLRVVAAHALILLTDPVGLDTLRKNLENKDWLVRALSAKYLGESGTHEDYDLLVSQLSREQALNTNDFVRAEIAIAALKLFPQKVEWERQEKERKKKKKIEATPPVVKTEPKPKKGVVLELEPLVVTAPRLKIPQGELVDSQIDFQLLRMLQQKEDMGISQEMMDQSPAYKDLNYLVTPNGIRLKTRYTLLGYLLTEGLAGTKDFQLLNELTRIARAGKNEDVRSYALIALAYGRDRNDLGLFQDRLRSDFPADRFAAIEALQIWGYPEAESILIGVTKIDTSPLLRVYAAQVVLRMGNLIGKDILVRALDDPDWIVRAMAMRYLGELGGGEDYSKILSYFGLQQKNIVQAEMCSALLRLYAKKIEQEQSE